MTTLELVKQLREYFTGCLAEGFTAQEAMQLTMAHQTAVLQNDMLEKMNRGGDKPWERL